MGYSLMEGRHLCPEVQGVWFVAMVWAFGLRFPRERLEAPLPRGEHPHCPPPFLSSRLSPNHKPCDQDALGVQRVQ